MFHFIKKNAILILYIYIFTSPVFSATYINHTRLVINEKQGEGVFTVYNEGSAPALIQIWTEKDNILGRPEDIKTPFVVSPHIFRLEGKASRAVRVQFTGKRGGLAGDRESLFWINTMEVPPLSGENNSKGTLQVAFRTRIKLLWRPNSLANIQEDNNIKRLVLVFNKCGNEVCIFMKNNTPLNITLMGLVMDNDTELNQLPDDGLISPFSEQTIILPDRTKENRRIRSFSWIDSYGVVKTEIK